MDLSRVRLMLGDTAVERLAQAHVAVFGLGGVGSFAAEALARTGIGQITLVDKDIVEASNINRQLIALEDTLGLPKVDVMAQRIRKINPQAEIYSHAFFFNAETCEQFDFKKYDYVVDAIDTVSAKILLAEHCYSAKIPLISSMGTGNKMDPTRFEVTDIYKTSVCPLARVMRRELKKRNIPALKVVYSKEEPLVPQKNVVSGHGKVAPGSISFVPPVAGMILAGEVIKYIIALEGGNKI
ncbi:MAG: tRNA threonylcarbamoyladenosine dehydratase [Clostridiales bacterium]|nr:MAG: tRNA threonylcarbamoyladenosine dehydratase [Clostridiales bacterium]